MSKYLLVGDTYINICSYLPTYLSLSVSLSVCVYLSVYLLRSICLDLYIDILLTIWVRIVFHKQTWQYRETSAVSEVGSKGHGDRTDCRESDNERRRAFQEKSTEEVRTETRERAVITGTWEEFCVVSTEDVYRAREGSGAGKID